MIVEAIYIIKCVMFRIFNFGLIRLTEVYNFFSESTVYKFLIFVQNLKTFVWVYGLVTIATSLQ